ncbi:hypothetical protein TTHERM_00535460 (macronuclear) [Tetrahymena thermophila SB210]|uniref:Uncharacterized protein n=1 Tax=Tetrahymena thermophila (strain SB210) TaxID=312017 RepID=I7LX06_TETTS|nr:hypothetical protein TTHERM_00535460 [Tetrahymena thermophila SB210]EAS03210.2 hypothetical protein TTHERM_00535460 [Tetrahymena thermophila SB210]|eukprot:XP_001023455.2 hypothetical protein TTHERM_00535460 [Tetrahymena thermophila SB210]
MEEGQINPQAFDGWDDTPSYDSSQTNAIKCFSDLFQQQIKTNKCSQQYQTTTKNSPKANKLNTTTNICLTDEESYRHKKNQINSFRKENLEQDQRLGRIFVVNQNNINAKPYRHQIIQSGISEINSNKEIIETGISYTQQNQPYQEIDNSQIFMKKNVFQDKSQRNQSLDSTSNFYNNNNSNVNQIGKRQNVSSIRQCSEASSVKGREKIYRNNKIDSNITQGSINNTNLSILKTNYDDKSQYTFLNNIMNESIYYQHGDEYQKQFKNQQYIYGQNQIQISQQLDNDKKFSTYNLTELGCENCQIQKDHQIIKNDTSILSQINGSTNNQNTFIPNKVNESNKQVLLTNNILIVQPDKFVPFHKQNTNLQLAQDLKNKKNLSNQQRNSQNSISIIINQAQNSSKIEKNIKDTTEDLETQCQEGNDLTNSFRQHKKNLQIYRNQIKNSNENKFIKQEIKLDKQIINNFNESNEFNSLKRNLDQPRLSQRLAQDYKKQNENSLVKSSSPSNCKSNSNSNANCQKDDSTIDNEFIENRDKENQTIQFNSTILDNLSSQNEKGDINFKCYQKEEKLFTVQSYFKYQDHQSNMNTSINNNKVNTDQGIDQLTQAEFQRNNQSSYNGIFRQTLTKFNYKPRKNKSVETDVANQNQKIDNIFYYYQQDKLPILKYQKHSTNEQQNQFINKVISSSRQNQQQLNTNRSKERLNTSMFIGASSRRSSNYDSINPVFRTPQQDKKIKQQRQSTAAEGNRINSSRQKNQFQDKRSTPIKAFNQLTNTTQQFRRANQLTKNQTINQTNSQIVQLGGTFDNTNPIQSFLLTNYKRSPSMEQQEQFNYLNKETVQNNFQHSNGQNRFNIDTTAYKENKATQKNVFRTTTNNFMYKTISPN